MITAPTIIERNPDLHKSEIDGKVVLMSMTNGSYYGLNPTGSKIWELLESPRSIKEVVEKLTELYNISFDDCKKDLLPYLQELISEKLIKTN